MCSKMIQEVIEMDTLLRIKELLDERSWSEYKLSKASGVSQSTLSNMFKRNNAPTIPTLESICEGFGITLSQFFSTGDDAIKRSPEQREMIDCWSTLTKEQKEILLQLIKKM